MIWGEFKEMRQIEVSKCKKWLNTMGKRKIQSFQDSFAELFNISLGIISIDNKSLTVWSNSSLFCNYIMKNNNERCKNEKKNIIDNVLKKREAIKYSCYMGITYFACPIFCNNDIVAICIGGGICLEENKALFENKATQNISRLSENKLNDIIKMLENTFNLLNINEDMIPEKDNIKYENRKELFFLENKLSLREIEVVHQINAGLSNKEISAELNISEKTVKTHITNILRKLNMKDRLQVVIFCKNNIMD